ncbi:MAG: ATP-binding protein, partial [Segatella oris]
KEYANSNDVTLNVNEGTDAEVWIDKRQMRKVVNNLISNALKHTPQGGNVNVTTECDGQQVILRVTDTGKGIAETDLAHVFDCFYQARDFESLTEMGTGIGLNLTQNIVQQHHGTISVDSVINEGTTFVVTLPLGKDHFKEDEIKVKKEDKKTEETVEDKVIQPQPDIVLEADAMPPVREMKGFEEATILIVEDNDDIRQLLMTVLSPYYRILTAVDGQEGLEVIRDEMPDIIISDVLMPNMSGIELCKIIKEDFAICHIPVVLLTARTAVEQELEGLKTGADDYITKPFNNELLISRCNNLINSRRLLQRKFGEHPHTEANMLASNPLDKEMLDRAMNIIDKHYMNSEFSVDVFAREMGMSRTSLFTKWKNLTGQTPNEFIMRIRLRKAAKMLRENPHLSIAEISYKNGFSSPRYFCKCFKDRYQQQPSAYRNGTE